MAITKVWIDDGCISCNNCEDIAPDVFEVNDICEVIIGADYLKNEELIKQAAEDCPVEVILFDED